MDFPTEYDMAESLHLWDEVPTSPTAAAARLMASFGSRLLAVRDSLGLWRLLVASPSGVWRHDDGALRELVEESARMWLASVTKEWQSARRDEEGVVADTDLTESLRKDRAAKAEAEVKRRAKALNEARNEVKRLADSQYQERVFRVAGAAIEAMRSGSVVPPSLTICADTDLDRPGPLIGAKNGIVNLDTGELENGERARDLQRREGQYITKQAGVSYFPQAADDPDPSFHRLLDRMSEDVRQWFIDAIAFAMRGRPDRRFYVLYGPKAGGKSSLMACVRGALGEYASAADPATLSDRAARETRSNATEIRPLLERRLVIYSEPRGKLSPQRIKDATGSDNLTYRPLYAQSNVEGPATATIVILANKGTIERLPMEDDAIEDRVRVLEMPTIPDEERVGLVIKMAEESEAWHETMFAMLVRAASEAGPTKPPDIPRVTTGSAAFRDEMIGEAGVWLRENVVKDPGGELPTADLWSSALRASGGEGGKVWDIERRAFIELAKQLHQLGNTKNLGSAGRRGWGGYRLLTSKESEAAQTTLEIETESRRIRMSGETPVPMNDKQASAFTRAATESGWRIENTNDPQQPGLLSEGERLALEGMAEDWQHVVDELKAGSRTEPVPLGPPGDNPGFLSYHEHPDYGGVQIRDSGSVRRWTHETLFDALQSLHLHRRDNYPDGAQLIGVAKLRIDGADLDEDEDGNLVTPAIDLGETS